MTYWSIYKWSVVVICSVLTIMWIYWTYLCINKQKMRCQRAVCATQACANVLLILQVTLLHKYTYLLAIAIGLRIICYNYQFVQMNIRFMAVYAGNKYVFEQKALPEEEKKAVICKARCLLIFNALPPISLSTAMCVYDANKYYVNWTS